MSASSDTSTPPNSERAEAGTLQEIGDLSKRVFLGNDKPLLPEGAYVLVVLNRALRVESNPVLDAAIAQASKLGIGLVVYSELNEAGTYVCDRLFYFALGAFREVARSLAKQHIPCVQTVRKATDTEDPLKTLAARAAAIYTDEDYTVWDQKRLQRIASVASQSVFFVDAARVVPTRALPSKGLKTTPAFRKGHSALREHYATLREETTALIAPLTVKDAVELDDFALNAFVLNNRGDRNFKTFTDAELAAFVSQCNINHDIKISAEHPPTQAEIKKRITTLKTNILAKYKWIRNNAALEHSTSQLSPYLHFGMLSPHQLFAEINSADVPKTYTWKFRDEFLTWREWSHYIAFHNPAIHKFEGLSNSAQKTLLAHKDDPRPEVRSRQDIIAGSTPDATWNAAQKEWLNTGWLHNNLRMYWAKQILRFTETPEEAWEIACYINDQVSLDGRDPATYASLQWAFGHAKPGYSEKPIYGWVAPKSDRAIFKRTGMKAWIAARQ